MKKKNDEPGSSRSYWLDTDKVSETDNVQDKTESHDSMTDNEIVKSEEDTESNWITDCCTMSLVFTTEVGSHPYLEYFRF
ncbi:hypothetical protein Bca4012_017906 [Brassica carinata]